LRYYVNEYFINMKNDLDEKISLEELVDQYFGNPENYFIAN